MESTPEEVHAVSDLQLNVRGQYLRQQLLAQAVHMASHRPRLLIVAKAQTRAGPK